MSLMVSARRVIMPTVVACVLMLTALALPASADDSTPTVSPTHGPPGTSVTASATDWTGCSSMSVTGWGTTLGTAAIDSTGAFSLTFTVPSNAPTGPAQLMFSPTCTHSTVAPFVTFTVDSPGTGMSAPAAPSNLTATAVDQNDIRLNWQDNSTNETGFEINNGVISKDAGAGSTTYTWGGLAAGTYMCFKIRAYNSAGDSAWDPNVSPYYVCTTTPKPAGASPPAAASNLTATAVDQHDIRLNWQDNSTNETGFEINNGVISKDAGAGSTTYTWGGLAAGTYMCFKIRAYNSAGDLAWDPNVSPYYVCTTTPKPKSTCPPTPQPRIYWSQIAGPQGARLSLTGNGWYANDTVTIHLPQGFHVARTSWPADSRGDWQLNIRVGDSIPPGSYGLTFSQSACGGLHVTGDFKVTMTYNQWVNAVSSINDLVQAGNDGCKIVHCPQAWTKSLIGKAIEIIGKAELVYYVGKITYYDAIDVSDRIALLKAEHAANGNLNAPAVQKAYKELQVAQKALETTLYDIFPPLLFIFPPVQVS